MDLHRDSAPAPAGSILVPFPEDVIVPMCCPKFAGGVRRIHSPEDTPDGAADPTAEISPSSADDWSRRNRRARLECIEARASTAPMAIRAAVSMALAHASTACSWPRRRLRSGSLVVLFPETAMTVRGSRFVALRSKADALGWKGFRTWLFAELQQTKAWWEGFLAAGSRTRQVGYGWCVDERLNRQARFRGFGWSSGIFTVACSEPRRDRRAAGEPSEVPIWPNGAATPATTIINRGGVDVLELPKHCGPRCLTLPGLGQGDGARPDASAVSSNSRGAGRSVEKVLVGLDLLGD